MSGFWAPELWSQQTCRQPWEDLTALRFLLSQVPVREFISPATSKTQLDVTVRITCFLYIIILWSCIADTYRTRTVKFTLTQAAWPAWQELKIIVWYLLTLYYHCKVAPSLTISHSSALSGLKCWKEKTLHDFFNLSLNTVFGDEPSCKITLGRKVRPKLWSDVKSKR